ncbi:MAG: type I DNA topoisomerase [Clostridia bacterium]|nr:type I DNA topoisomerase [Clostridia bacterium]
MSILVIVESPAKANTIKSYLGNNYKVIASKGHIRDLPKSTLGIDVDNGFEPHYINIRGKGDVIKLLKKEAKSATKVFLATDPDREGEAISWHIANQLGIPSDKACRVTFNEITKNAVKESIKNPRTINEDLVNSQQARRILDRLVGFKLSEALWKNLKSGLSGGRVQSVATRIITEREEEIRAFVPSEYWTVEAVVSSGDGENITLRLFGDENGKIKVNNREEAEKIESAVRGGVFKVRSVKHYARTKQPAPPFTTSTLQQEASKQLGYQSQRIMKIAQELYDGLNLGSEFGGVQGLITYMRTDSTRVSPVAVEAAKEYIKTTFGEEYLPKAKRSYKSGAASQDAHEAIRPSNIALEPQLVKRLLSTEQYRLYKLIWERFIASQMESCVLDTVACEIDNNGYVFKTGGYIVKSRGYLTVYEKDDIEPDGEYENLKKLPSLKKGQTFDSYSLKSTQHFTEPPARYTEASLIKFLEENGIGRPSTYAPIISIIIGREYVKRDGKSLVATPLGEITTRFMRKYFPEIIDYEFTASMETKLDSIEMKKNTISGVISDFYEKFEKELEVALSEGHNGEFEMPKEESDVLCDRCGKPMLVKNGRFGKFLACSGYPACKHTMTLDKDGKPAKGNEEEPTPAGFKCEMCGGEMVIRNGRYGIFYACSNYPDCTFTKHKTTELDVPCPMCGHKIVARHGKGKMLFYSCENHPDCGFSSWDMPLNEKCPDCGGMLFYRKSRKSVICKEKGCEYKREEEMTVIE